jgi:HipA-like protein
MKIRELIAILDRREMGRFFRDMKGRVCFVYDEKWRNAADAYPLSLSMPLTLGEHGNSKTDPFLWGLLPDNEQVLDQWGKKFQVSSRNAFGLIAGVGEDCTGAVQFVRPDRLDAILGKQPPEIEWLTPGDIAQRLRSLREDHAAWRNPRDTGQFSLAGAQPKTALLLEEGRWGIPSGRTPTTHIFKPPTTHFDGHAENEHFCLELGRAIGLPVANSEVMRFEDEIAIVIERYDRVHAENVWQRVHQEDTCQALSIQPTRKYQSDGGPGVRAACPKNRRALFAEDSTTSIYSIPSEYARATSKETNTLTSLAGNPTSGIMKDVFMLGGYQEAEVDFVADNPGLTLFHCHQQLHMDFGFMTLFDYVWCGLFRCPKPGLTLRPRQIFPTPRYHRLWRARGPHRDYGRRTRPQAPLGFA